MAEFREHVWQAFTVVRTPGAGSALVMWQLADWALRLATIWFMLDAFGIEQSLRNVLLVQATQSLATLVPISPGGVGTEQALLVYTLRGQASRSALLAFSVGMKLTLTVVNVVLGFTAILLTLRTLRFAGCQPGAGTETRRRPARSSPVPPVLCSCPYTARAVFAGSPGTPSSSSCEAARNRSAEPKCCRIARRRAGPMPSSVSKIEANARVSRRWRWKPSAKRCASSRMRWSSCRPGSCRSSRIGCELPGTNTSSSRFASAITATRGRPGRLDRLERRRQLPLAAVDHDEVRHRREALVVRPAPAPSRSRAKRRAITCAIDAKSSWPSRPRTVNVR